MNRFKGPLIARPLPAELLEKGSDLHQLVTIAGDLSAQRTEGANALANKARTLLHNACPSYKKSFDPERVFHCASGERDGKPIRPECTRCIVSQFSANGFFVGDIQAQKGQAIEG